MNCPVASRQRGLTLLELVVAMTILVILTSLATPPLRGLLQSMRTESEMAEFVNTLQSARAESIRTGHTVTVCSTRDNRACQSDVDVWEGGWMTFVDINANGVADPDDTVLRTSGALRAGDILRLESAGGPARPTRGISFNREGFATGIASGTRFVLRTQPLATGATRCLLISPSGRLNLRSGRTDPANCA